MVTRQEVRRAIRQFKSLKRMDYVVFLFAAVLLAGIFALGYYSLGRYF